MAYGKREVPKTWSKIGQTTEVVMAQIRARERELAGLPPEEEETEMPKKKTNIEKAHNAIPRHLFLAVWETNTSVDGFVSACKRLGYTLKYETAIGRAQRYRKGSKRHEAVALKFLEGEGNTTATLNRTIEDLIAAGDTKGIAAFLKANS